MNPLIFNLTDLSSEFYSMVRGALILLAIYHIIIYFLYRDTIFLYYSLYSFILYLFLIIQISTGFWAEVYDHIDRSFQLLIFASYLLFTRQIIQTKKLIPNWDNHIKYTVLGTVIITIPLALISIFYSNEIKLFIFYFVFIICAIFSMALFIRLSIENKYHVKLFIFGSLFFLLMVITTLSIVFFEKEAFFAERGFHRLFFLYVGAIVEFIVFAFLISYRYKELTNEKAEIDLALSKYKIESSELKLMTLTSQLNPHFLFNTLNSINNQVIKNQVEEASDYITKFARLIRNILNNSNQSTITLSEELANLKIYITLEKIRTNYNFEYSEIIDKNISLTMTKVPPLFLQPFVENAIWHGFPLNQGDNKITLTISAVDQNFIKFELVDNGIGINKSLELEKLNVYKKKGIATDSAIYRINRVFNYKNFTFERIDNTNAVATGTKVVIIFPKIC